MLTKETQGRFVLYFITLIHLHEFMLINLELQNVALSFVLLKLHHVLKLGSH